MCEYRSNELLLYYSYELHDNQDRELTTKELPCGPLYNFTSFTNTW